MGSISAQEESLIPSWIKSTASFWVNDQISDSEFIAALQFLVSKDILTIPADTTESDTQSDTTDTSNSETPTIEEPQEQEVNTDLELLQFKIEQLEELASHPEVIAAVIESNSKFSVMDDVFAYIDEKDAEWKKQPKNQDSPLMGSLMQNNIADILRTKSVIQTEKFGDVLFPEIIVTNQFGANVAITARTDDYDQGDESWWIQAKKTSVQIRDVMWDESAKIHSADLIIRIVDDKGKFIGVLNAATPVR